MHSLIDIEDALYSLIVKSEQKKALAAKEEKENTNKGGSKESGRPANKRRSTPYEIKLPENEQKEGGEAEAT